jgi:acetate---CoA ligase (ADP-forming)
MPLTKHPSQYAEGDLEHFFRPSSVVVVGVSTRSTNLGKEIARNLFEFEYNGVIHFVGVQGGVLFGRKIHASIDEIQEPIDLAIVLTPSKTIPGVLEQCGAKGIRRVVIESGGFGEFDGDGHQLGEQVKAVADKYGIRFIGPNCIGIMNSANGLATPFTTMRNVFPRGGVGIMAQSGGVALTFLNMFHGEQLGFSKFASIGNKLNVDENDLLEYLVQDPETSVICMYLESIKDGRRLTEIARRSPKPIVVHKANVAPMSSAIAQSHTEALANDDAVVDAALHQAGIVRFTEMQGYLDFVKILQLPEMKGRNLAIVSRSGGHAVIAADAAFQYGFQLPPFGTDFLEEIRTHLRADVIRLGNPLDLGDLFDFDVYVRIIEYTLQQKNVDGVVFLHTYFEAIEGESSRKLLQSAASLSDTYGKPVAMCVSTEQAEISRLHKEFEFPIFLSPERAIGALDREIKRRQRMPLVVSAPAGPLTGPPPHDAKIDSLLHSLNEEQRSPLLHESLDIVRMTGLSVPDFALIQETSDLDDCCRGLAGPYAVKVVAEGLSHKSDVGGVALGVSREALGGICSEMMGRFRSTDCGFRGILVQQMAERKPGALELIVGAKRDPQFGPIVLLGHGGVLVEVLGKTSLRMAPLSEAEVDEMMEDLPGSDIFKGVRGMLPTDRKALKDAILRVAHLMVRFPQIDSLDINPILASPTGVRALDARIFLASAADRTV